MSNKSSSSSSNSPPKLDLARLEEIASGDIQFEKELFELYEATYIEKQEALDKAVQGKDLTNSVAISHEFKGASANIGAEAARRVSEKLEKICKDSNWEEASTCLKDWHKEMKETIQAMKDRVEKLST